MTLQEFQHALAVAMPVLGHISFALTFASYAQRDIIRLRLIAVASLVLGLAYNLWINAQMPGEDNIWLVIGWLSIFLVQNVYFLVTAIREGLETSLPHEMRELMVQSFPMMHSRDWQTLIAKATIKRYCKGAQILGKGEPTSALQLIVEGVAQETRCDQSRECGRGTLWGELTYVMGKDYFNASPVSIRASSANVTVYEWDYDKLKDLATKSLRLQAALQHGFVHSAGMKHGLLWSGERLAA